MNWIGAEAANANIRNIQQRLDELAPGIEDAKAQLSETQKMVDEANAELKIVLEDLNLVEAELEVDSRQAIKKKDLHSHNLPKEITDNAKRKSQLIKSNTNALGEEEASLETTSSPNRFFSFFRRLFRRNRDS